MASKKTPVKISKTFGVKVSAEYQSYDFSSTMELVLPKEIDLLNKDDQMYISRCNNWLSTTVIEETVNDIKAFAGHNEKFRTILAARNKKIELLPQKSEELAVSSTSNMDV